MQSAIPTGNTKESSGICFSREASNSVFHQSCTFGAASPPENKFRILSSHERKHVDILGVGSSPITARAGIYGLERGDKRYELSNHLGNVLAVVSDRRAKASCADTLVSGYWADVVSTNDYYPFGMGMVERGDDGGYRYGFNGQERDDEVAGAGNSYTSEYWQYDGRLGKRWNVDPVVRPFLGAYVSFSNMPILKVDTNGALDYINANGEKIGDDGNLGGAAPTAFSENPYEFSSCLVAVGIRDFFRFWEAKRSSVWKEMDEVQEWVFVFYFCSAFQCAVGIFVDFTSNYCGLDVGFPMGGIWVCAGIDFVGRVNA